MQVAMTSAVVHSWLQYMQVAMTSAVVHSWLQYMQVAVTSAVVHSWQPAPVSSVTTKGQMPLGCNSSF